MGYTIWPDGICGEVVEEVYKERARQERLREAGKFLWTCADPKIDDARKLAVLAEEFGEAAREVTDAMIASDKSRTREDRAWDEAEAAKIAVHRAKLREELIQVAAVAVAWAESLPRAK